MSTTTLQAYRPAYAPQGEVPEVTTTCSCGQVVTGSELFSHDCPDDIRKAGSFRSAAATVATSDADSLDVTRGGPGGHSPAHRAAAPTERQISFLRSLLSDLDAVTDVDAMVALVKTGREASRMIDATKAELASQQAAKAAVATVPQAPVARPNRFAGPCRSCGAEVPAAQGLLVGRPGAWAVEHHAGQCKPASGHTAADPAPVADVAAGHYAIESTGSNDLAFYRVDRPTEGDYAGQTFVKLIVGGHPDRNVRHNQVAGILARIAADPDAAVRYGHEIRRCYVCNHTLTDEASRAAGIGPECAKR